MFKDKFKNVKYYLDFVGWKWGLKFSSIGLTCIGTIFYNLCRFSFNFEL